MIDAERPHPTTAEDNPGKVRRRPAATTEHHFQEEHEVSAIMLPRLHIHCLVGAGFLPLPEMDREYPLTEFEPMRFRLKEGGDRTVLGAKTADEIGQILVDTNLSSLIDRYTDPTHLIHENDIKRYQWPHLDEALTTPVETLNAIACYEYQASEHDEWKTSLARRYCQSLRRHVCNLVPGYHEAGWCMLARKVDERRAVHLL